jgi:5'-nucleotidase
MHILISNDDGINAPGLRALTQAMLPLGKVTVLAPEENQSATGHKKTLLNPLRIRRIKDYAPDVEAFAINGSPSDCTAVAMLGFVKERIDLVVSGINFGANVAQDVTYSGTVAVALEAVIMGVPAIAFSLDVQSEDPDFAPPIEIARKVTQAYLSNGRLPDMTILNVNIPDAPINGWKVTRQGVREYRDKLSERIDPRGYPYYWIGGERPTGDVELVDTDLWAVHNGYVSLTPIHLDLTAHSLLPKLAEWKLEF